MAVIERRVIEATLKHHDGNKTHAAKTLGIALKTLYNRLAEYERTDLLADLKVDLP